MQRGFTIGLYSSLSPADSKRTSSSLRDCPAYKLPYEKYVNATYRKQRNRRYLSLSHVSGFSVVSQYIASNGRMIGEMERI